MNTNRPFFIKRLNGWYIKTVLPNGKRSQKLLGRTKDEAYRVWKAEPESSGTRYSFIAAAFTDAMKKSMERGEVSAAWYQRIESHLKRFGKANPGITVAEIIPHTVTTYLSSRNLAPDTERTEISDLKRCFAWAVEQGLISKSPIEKMKRPTGKPRQTWVDPATHVKIMEAAPKRFKPFIQAIWECGCRPGELRSLTWDMISKCRRFAVLPKHKSSRKTPKPRILYFGAKTTEWLKKVKPEDQEGFVFLNRFGNPYTKDAIRCAFRRIREDAGVKGVVAYSYRHAFPARAITSGVDPMTIAEMMGHSDVKMIVDVYGHLAKETKHLLDAAKKANG